jgi:hypothetical protein
MQRLLMTYVRRQLKFFALFLEPFFLNHPLLFRSAVLLLYAAGVLLNEATAEKQKYSCGPDGSG